MRVLKRIALVVLALVALIMAIGLFLPRQVHVERATTITAAPATVFALVNSYRNFNKWSPWHDIDPNTQYTYEGPEIGVGAKMTWKADARTVGSGSQEIVASRAPEWVKTSLDFGAQGRATAQFSLAPEGGGTRVVWSLDTDMGASPVGRYFGLMMDSIVGKDYEKGLQGLKVLAESLPKADFANLQVDRVSTAAGKALKVAHTGGHQGLADTREKLAAYMAAYGYEASGAPWDEDVTGPGRTAEADRVTNVYMPVR